MSVKMTRYKQAEFEEEDSSSVGSVHLTEGTSGTATHVRYHTGSTLWKARSTLEKALLSLCLALLLLVLILGALLSAAGGNESSSASVVNGKSSSSSDGISSGSENERDASGLPYCLSPSCVTAAASLLGAMDQSVEPCEDFYGYACGGWVRSNPVPEGRSMWGTFGKLERQNQLVVRNVLDKPFTELKSKAEQKAKLYYTSCLDVNETMELLGNTPMLQLLRDIGGWNITPPADWNPSLGIVGGKVPVGGKGVGKSGGSIKKASATEAKHWWSPESWNLQKTIQLLQNRYNMVGLFSWAVGEDDRNSSRHVIQIDQGGLTLPTRDNYLNKTANEKVLTAYLDYMTKIGVLLGGEENSTKRQMAAIIDLETKLAEITTPADERRDEEKMYHQMSIAELQEKAPFMSWKEYFSDALRLVNRKVTSKEVVVVYAPDYIEKMSNLVVEYNKTAEGKTVLNNYLVWQTVRSLTACLSRAFRDAYRGLRKALVGSEGGEEPWRYCVTDTTNALGFAVGAMFVREVFHGESKPAAEEMINEVRTAFKKNLRNLSWMDKETIDLAENKADAITDMIGFPNYILDPSQLDEKYKELEIRDDEYFGNNVRVNQYNLKRNLEKLDQPVNKTRWGMTPPTVNAYYTPTKNQIVFPAGILQAPFYDIKHPRSLNFGGMGVVMGHELTHAFDDQGREYDQYGNLHQWWNDKTIEKFKQQTDCVVNQYSKYELNGQHLNGKQTLGENIADNGGLKAAYHAYLDWASRHNEEERPLPGLNLTHRQLFFLGFSQVWCSSSTGEATRLQIEKDAHAPPKFRVIGPLSNLPEFSQEFSCPPGSPMNPTKKCEVW